MASFLFLTTSNFLLSLAADRTGAAKMNLGAQLNEYHIEEQAPRHHLIPQHLSQGRPILNTFRYIAITGTVSRNSSPPLLRLALDEPSIVHFWQLRTESVGKYQWYVACSYVGNF